MILIILVSFFLPAQENKIQLGAYYFNGWSPGSKHITKALTNNFPERQPKWGWITGTQEIMNDQINLAADAGLSFFSFCWFYTKNKPLETSNKIVSYYLNSPDRKRLKYCLLVANHQGHQIGPDVWPALIQEWVRLFKTDSYVTVNGKPLLIFFAVESLIKKFGSTQAVHDAFSNLKRAAINKGLNGVTVAACVGPGKGEIRQAESCGFEVLTGYSYHSDGIKVKTEQRQIPIGNMINVDEKLWNLFPAYSSLPYIPVSTLNYDPRPLADSTNKFATKPYLVGFSSNSVYKSVKSISTWILQYKQQTTKEKIGLLYAWNEYSEGAWLTPSKNSDMKLLDGLKHALQKK